ncbi:MAG TPA: hypothetical protein PLD59_09925 [Tepidisphaeraceae bacterium]|mgnify:CR=1 FL=1|nr:hypothetical protein [Tepidisphaeraceae bacterium]
MSKQPGHFQDRFTYAGPTFRSWLRETFSASGIAAIVRTLAWLIPLTILVWFYAARSISAPDSVTRRVAVRSNDPGRRVALQNDSLELKIAYIGTDARVKELERQLSGMDSLVLTVDATQASGAVYQLAKPILEQNEPFRSNRGVRITGVTPDTIGLDVDTYVEQTVDVKVPDALKSVVQSAVFDPPQVTVRGASRDIAAAEANGGLFAEADLANLPILREPGRKDSILVTLRAPSGMTVKPTSATAALEIGSKDIAYELKSVPVWPSLPPEFVNEFRVTVTPGFISNVQVLGPQEQIDLLQAGLVIKARLDFTPEELRDARDGRFKPKKPIFELPPNVKVDPQRLANISVEWSVQRREGSN